MNLPETLPFQGRVILISGAGGGLGAVAAKACAGQGACVVLLDKAVKSLEKLYDEMVGSGYTQPAIYPLDLEKATEADFVELAGILDSQFGVLNGLLHSAADVGFLGPLADVNVSQWEKLLKINLTATHSLTRALLPLLQRSQDASIVFTTNSSARKGQAYWGAYGVANMALEGLARMWADELAGAACVRVNVFVPGPVNSPVRRKTHPGELPTENPSPDTLASRYIHLLGPESKGFNGQIIEGLD